MPNQITQIAGTQLFVAPIDDQDDLPVAVADYSGARNAGSTAPATGGKVGTWLEVAELQELGEFGREYNLVTYSSLAKRGTDKFKGTYNDGSFSVPVGRDDDDPGQKLMNDALNSDNKYAFCVRFPGGTATTSSGADYFVGLVTNFRSQGGGLDAILFKQLTVELTSTPLTDNT